MDRLWNNLIYKTDIAQAAAFALPWEQLNNKTLLITGATGMIASAIIDILMGRNRDYGQHITIYAISRSEDKARERFGLYWKEPG
ncbi:MAG: SDR family NAD-dependent epimerase/dehydratase, partial [Lachnospiraceae bacterium]|nr:SDR family NAD-dependent epimerase/dehydratase [Lachnospiraceae bacterium]